MHKTPLMESVCCLLAVLRECVQNCVKFLNDSSHRLCVSRSLKRRQERNFTSSRCPPSYYCSETLWKKEEKKPHRFPSITVLRFFIWKDFYWWPQRNSGLLCMRTVWDSYSLFHPVPPSPTHFWAPTQPRQCGAWTACTKVHYTVCPQLFPRVNAQIHSHCIEQ